MLKIKICCFLFMILIVSSACEAQQNQQASDLSLRDTPLPSCVQGELSCEAEPTSSAYVQPPIRPDRVVPTPTWPSVSSCQKNTSSCQPKPTATLDPHKPSPLQEWIDNPLCEAPCWQGITPGITTYEESIVILKSQPNIVIKQHSIDPNDMEIAIDELDWTDSQGDNGSLSYKPDTKVIQVIYPPLRGEIRLEQVIDRYGEPDYLIVYAYIDQEFDPHPGESAYGLSFVFLEGGLWMDVVQSSRSLHPEISPQMLLEDPGFFAPLAFNFKSQYRSDLVSWQGFHTFEWYCLARDSDTDMFCDPSLQQP